MHCSTFPLIVSSCPINVLKTLQYPAPLRFWLEQKVGAYLAHGLQHDAMSMNVLLTELAGRYFLFQSELPVSHVSRDFIPVFNCQLLLILANQVTLPFHQQSL